VCFAVRDIRHLIVIVNIFIVVTALKKKEALLNPHKRFRRASFFSERSLIDSFDNNDNDFMDIDNIVGSPGDSFSHPFLCTQKVSTL
jgi:hypothetical protein